MIFIDFETHVIFKRPAIHWNYVVWRSKARIECVAEIVPQNEAFLQIDADNGDDDDAR